MTTDVDKFALSKTGDRIRHKFSVAWIRKANVRFEEIRRECLDVPNCPMATGLELSPAAGKFICSKLDISNDVGQLKVIVDREYGLKRFAPKQIRRIK